MKLDSLQSRRVWLVGGTVLALLIVAASYFLVILPKLGAASDTRAQARANDSSNAQLLARQATLARQEKNIAGMRLDLAAAILALPPTSALPEFTHEVTQAAAASNVALKTINISALAPVTSTSAAPQAPAATGSATSSTTTATSAPAAATQYQLNISLTTNGLIADQLAFVRAIQNGPRRALIISTTYSGSGTANGRLALTTQLTIFTAPMSAQQAAQLRKLLVAS